MLWLWTAFIVVVIALLAIDLGIFHRREREVPLREALWWAVVWITLGLGFSVFVYFAYDRGWAGLGTAVDPVDGKVNTGITAAVKYLTGYLVEESLSVDNLFVMAVLFGYFGVPARYQHRVLFWGIVGALVMRGLMIGLGVSLIARFHWTLYVFGILLIITAIKMMTMHTEEADPGRNAVVRLARRFFPVTTKYHGKHFVVRAGSRHAAASTVRDEIIERARPGTIVLTPLALALISIETTDLVFAFDSIPAIFAITADPFLVFTSNVCAILGLRSLYSALAHMLSTFRYLKPSLAVVLLLVGIKMLTADWLKETLGEHFTLYFLGIVVVVLGTGIVTSLVVREEEREG